jgi:Type III restriction enzyme, res subunit
VVGLDALCDKLGQTPNDHALIRPYQQEANATIEEAIQGRKRQMLVAVATGTGKRFTLVNELYRLMKAGVCPPCALLSGSPRAGRTSPEAVCVVRCGARLQIPSGLRGLSLALPPRGFGRGCRRRSATQWDSPENLSASGATVCLYATLSHFSGECHIRTDHEIPACHAGFSCYDHTHD